MNKAQQIRFFRGLAVGMEKSAVRAAQEARTDEAAEKRQFAAVIVQKAQDIEQAADDTPQEDNSR